MKFQLGKNGITEGTIENLERAFKHHSVVRISVLRSLAPTKEKMSALADELIARFGGGYRVVRIGFTLVLKKRSARVK